MISSTPRHCWKLAGWATQSRVTRPWVCWARRAAKRTATLHSGDLSTTTRNLRGRSRAGSLMAAEADTMPGRAARESRAPGIPGVVLGCPESGVASHLSVGDTMANGDTSYGSKLLRFWWPNGWAFLWLVLGLMPLFFFQT